MKAGHRHHKKSKLPANIPDEDTRKTQQNINKPKGSYTTNKCDLSVSCKNGSTYQTSINHLHRKKDKNIQNIQR